MEKQHEVTMVYNVQVTTVMKGLSPRMVEKLENADRAGLDRLAKAMKVDLNVDDVQILGHQMFIRDEEVQEDKENVEE